MQLAYNINMGIANPGQLADAMNDHIESFQAYEIIGLGLGIVARTGSDYTGRLPKANKGTIVFAGDLITANVVNAKVNGNAMSPVTFLTDHLTTMGLICVALAAVSGVASATLDATDGTHRTIIVRSNDGIDCLVTDVIVTLGVTQTTATITTSTFDVIHGVSVSTMAKEEALNTLLVNFKVGEAVPTLRKGKIYVKPETNVAPGDPVYCRFTGANGTTKLIGQFRNDSDSGSCVLYANSLFRTTALATNVAVIEVNNP
jgi:hypothetical protein